MEEIQDGIEIQEVESQESEPLSDNSEATEQVDQQVDGTVPEQEYDWTKDDRYKRMWKEDTNNMYKSYRSLENQYETVKDFQNKYSDLTKKFEEKGLSIDLLDDYFNEYNELKDPNNPRNQDLQVLENFMSNPDYEQRIGNFFRELQTEDLQRQFPNMNQQQIEQQLQMKQELEQLKAAEQKRQYEADTQKYYQSIQENTDKITKFATDRGFEITNDIKSEVLEYCAKNNLQANNMLAVFLDLYGDKVFEAQENKMRDSYTKNINKTNKVNIPNAKKSSSPTKAKTSEANMSKLRDAISKGFGKI